MPVVSEKEWLDRSRGVDSAEDMAEQMEGHREEGYRPRPVTERSGRRGERRRGGRPSPGSAQGRVDVPAEPGVLPGSLPHIEHPEVLDMTAPALLDVGPAKPYYSGMMAHGVAAPVVHGGRPAPMDHERAGMAATARPEQPAAGPEEHPVPVYIVDVGAGSKPLRRMATKQVSLPAQDTAQGFATEPVLIAGRDVHRRRVRLLNEDASNGGRISVGPTSEKGVLLPANMTSYEDFDTSDDVWGVSDATSAVYLSVILEYEVPGGA